ncbi:acyltransferase family protein [Oliverpabstia intestinalis]|uniref:acyltransferase family protein n=1 Tax=Oliverpabstia intestinalis TaxID=2606633 RepID=UPI003F8BF47A
MAGHVAQNYNMSRVMQIFYSFHMPLFFIIAGYFISASKSTKEFCLSRGKKILGYYIFTCFVLIAFRIAICHTDEIGMLWFLLAMLWSQCIVKFFLRYSTRICQCLVVLTTAIGIISVNYIWLPFSIQNGMAASIWIYIGYTIKEKNILQLAENNYKYKKIFIILCMLFWCISIMKGQTEL